jgi:hypothetical protein
MFVKSSPSSVLSLTKFPPLPRYIYSYILLEALEFWELSGALDALGNFIPEPLVHLFLPQDSRPNYRLANMQRKHAQIQWKRLYNVPQSIIPLAFDANGKPTWSFQQVTSHQDSSGFPGLISSPLDPSTSISTFQRSSSGIDPCGSPARCCKSPPKCWDSILMHHIF